MGLLLGKPEELLACALDSHAKQMAQKASIF